MRNKLLKIREILDELIAISEEENKPPRPVVAVAKQTAPEENFEDLKILLDSEDWPEAVFSLQIADENSEGDKDERASGIADILLPPLKGKKFLDFGCGEGHVAKYVSSEASVSVGYDIERSERSLLMWEDATAGFLLTVDIEKVKSYGPYDAILIYDVLDHAKDPTGVLSTAKSLLSDDGTIYLRCHPWCGRHGGHIYRALNKAFAHLVFSEDELKKLGLSAEYTRTIIFPLSSYDSIIKSAGFEAHEPEIERQEVEPFFYDNELVRSRILNRFDISEWTAEKPVFQMSQCFLDYKLKK